MRSGKGWHDMSEEQREGYRRRSRDWQRSRREAMTPEELAAYYAKRNQDHKEYRQRKKAEKLTETA